MLGRNNLLNRQVWLRCREVRVAGSPGGGGGRAGAPRSAAARMRAPRPAEPAPTHVLLGVQLQWSLLAQVTLRFRIHLRIVNIGYIRDFSRFERTFVI